MTSFPHVSLPKPFVLPYFARYVQHTRPVSFFLLLPEYYLVRQQVMFAHVPNSVTVIPLVKLVLAQDFKLFVAFYEPRYFVTIFTSIPGCYLSWVSRFQSTRSYLISFNRYFNTVIPSARKSSKWSFSFRFSHQVTCTRYSSAPSEQRSSEILFLFVFFLYDACIYTEDYTARRTAAGPQNSHYAAG